jgi:AAA15 family ATPase/GTPase
MLIEFRFKNFKSFRDEQVLSMVASSDKSLPENVITAESLGKRRLVRSAVLYGANASGKSNFVDAFRFLYDFVRASAEREQAAEIPVQSFRLSKADDESPSEFEVSFVHHQVRYQYGFSVDRERVHEEWLIAYPKGLPQKWFERSPALDPLESEWYFGPQLKGEKKRLVSVTRPDVLFLSVAATFNHEQLSEVYEWFSRRLLAIQIDNLFTLSSLEQLAAKEIVKSEDFGAKVRNLMQIADLGVVSLAAEERDFSETGFPANVFSKEVRSFIFERKVFDIRLWHHTQDRAGRGVPFLLKDESLGTRRLFAMSLPWLLGLEKGATLVVDELDASLHPVLVREMVSSFHDLDANSQNAQLIFNTHDTTLLDSSLFRRDQVWFVEKDNAGASHLYPLLEFSPRKGEALAKGYLQGRYGALPFIEGFAESLLDKGASDGEG